VRYLLNLPLGLAALLQLLFAGLVLMPGPWAGWSDGPSRGAMGLVMLEPALFAWLLLLPVPAAAVFAGAFDWLPVRRRRWQLMLVAGASVVTLLLTVPCVIVAIGGSAAVGDSDSQHIGRVLILGATIAATLVPLVVMAWLAWVIDAPPLLRHAALPRGIGLGALALTALTGGILGTQMLGEEFRIYRETAERYRQMDDERDVAIRTGFAKLSDASELRSWVGYTDRFTPNDIRQAALRGLAARPTLEPDLIAALQQSDTDFADNTLLAIAALSFQPSAALEAPLRAAFVRLARKIRTVREPGSGNDFGSYLDGFFEERLAAILVVLKKMADSAGVDLRDALRDVQSAIAEAYPDSKSAKTYPREVAAAAAHIEAALAARRQRN
jgi:hypothetical protein